MATLSLILLSTEVKKNAIVHFCKMDHPTIEASFPLRYMREAIRETESRKAVDPVQELTELKSIIESLASAQSRAANANLFADAFYRIERLQSLHSK